MISSYPSICFSGLSPLARGTRDDSIAADESERFIPAGAGNSAGNITNKINVNGLSPLARGTQPLFKNLVPFYRFIPAGAGNSRNEALDCRNYAVYPRWRGELSKHNLLLINDFLSQSQSTNFTVSHKQHIHYVKEYFIH